jgi:hypothetical protein
MFSDVAVIGKNFSVVRQNRWDEGTLRLDATGVKNGFKDRPKQR